MRHIHGELETPPGSGWIDLGIIVIWFLVIVIFVTCNAGCAGFEGSVSSYVGETDSSEFVGGMFRVSQPIAPRWSLFGQTEILRYPGEWWTQTYGGVTYSFGGKK